MVNDRIAREIARIDSKDRKYILTILLQMEKIFDECPETRRRITQEIVRNSSKKT
jgi:hypothetical protein